MARPCEKELENVDDLAGGNVERELAEDDREQKQLQTEWSERARVRNLEADAARGEPSVKGDVRVTGILRAAGRSKEISLMIMGLSDTSEPS